MIGATLQDLIDDVESRIRGLYVQDAIDPQITRYQIVDEVQGATEYGAIQRHLGVSVHHDGTQPSDVTRARRYVEVVDTLRVTLTAQLAVHQQAESRRQVLRHAEQIRDALRGMREWRALHEDTDTTEPDEGWWQVDQFFTFRRWEVVNAH